MTWKHSKTDGDNQFKCFLCQKPLPNNAAVRSHIFFDHFKMEPFKCNFCPQTFKRQCYVKRHEIELHDTHPNHELQCGKCQKKFTKYKALKEHQIDEHTEKATCSYCGKSFRTNSLLKIHLKSHESPVGHFVCDQCGKEYEREISLENHKKLHREQVIPGGFKCTMCEKAFDKARSLKDHIKNSHSNIKKEKNKQCSFCPKMFFDEHSKKLHENTMHLNKKDFKCDLCDYATARKSHLKEHIMSIHDGVTFTCEFPGCNKSYNLKGSLALHRERIHNIPRLRKKVEVD